MAYNPVAQASSDFLSDDTDSVAFASPQNDNRFRPLSLELGNSDGHSPGQARKDNAAVDTCSASLTRSEPSIGNRYDVIEHDDYDDFPLSPAKETVDDLKDNSVLNHLPPRFAPPTKYTRPQGSSLAQSLRMEDPATHLRSLGGHDINKSESSEKNLAEMGIPSTQDKEFRITGSEPRQMPGHEPGLIPNSSLFPQSFRQISTTSLSNSLIEVDTVPESAADHAGGPEGSIISRSWSYGSDQVAPSSKNALFVQPRSEQGFDSQYVSLASGNPPSAPTHAPPPPPPHAHQPESYFEPLPTENPQLKDNGDDPDPKPSRSTSNNTYRQETSLFGDFDGVHYTSRWQQSPSRQGSLKLQAEIDPSQLSSNKTPHDGPLAGEKKVFYPAPVPVVLNLPPKLSKLPSAAERERRRLTALKAMPSDMRKSAAWLNGDGEASSAHEHRKSQAHSRLPPQIRASAFFDQPAVSQRLDIKGASATETLDNMLEAAAYAPVTAFTDHPYVGHLGAEILKPHNHRRKSSTFQPRENQRRPLSHLSETGSCLDVDVDRRLDSSSDILMASPNRSGKRQSNNTLNEGDATFAEGEHAPLGTSVNPGNPEDCSVKPQSDGAQEIEGASEEGDGDDEGKDNCDNESDTPEYDGPPTTLLAELQMRKAQQKRRNRTAANAFPNGMHSTLLELDAVMQLQQKSRKKKHLTLAWEDRVATDPSHVDDDDVPLGLLVAGGTRSMQQSISRPMGLVEKREMEDSEPLSRRRARLRGEDIIRPGIGHFEQQRDSMTYTLDSPALADKLLDEKEDETLAQRIRRIKAERGSAIGLGAEFAQEVSSQFGLETEKEVPRTSTAEAEESLGQRRNRLRDEGLESFRHPSSGSTPNRAGIKARASMADILSQHPAGGSRQPSSESKGPAQYPTFGPAGVQQPMMSAYSMPTTVHAYPQFNSNAPYMNGVAGFNYNDPTLYNPLLAMQNGGYGQWGYAHGPSTMGPSLDAKQRDVIDRWRQGIAP